MPDQPNQNSNNGADRASISTDLFSVVYPPATPRTDHRAYNSIVVRAGGKWGEGPVVVRASFARELEQENRRFRHFCQLISDLADGYDEKGATGHQEPLSWETVGRLAIDYANAAFPPENANCPDTGEAC